MRLVFVLAFMTASLCSTFASANEIDFSKPQTSSIIDVVDEAANRPDSYCSVTIYCPEGGKQCDATGARTSCRKGNNWIECVGVGHDGQVARVSYICQYR